MSTVDSITKNHIINNNNKKLWKWYVLYITQRFLSALSMRIEKWKRVALWVLPMESLAISESKFSVVLYKNNSEENLLLSFSLLSLHLNFWLLLLGLIFLFMNLLSRLVEEFHIASYHPITKYQRWRKCNLKAKKWENHSTPCVYIEPCSLIIKWS